MARPYRKSGSLVVTKKNAGYHSGSSWEIATAGSLGVVVCEDLPHGQFLCTLFSWGVVNIPVGNVKAVK